MGIAGKWAFVTGGTRGIGKGVVKTLAARGYPVVFTYRASAAAAERLTAEIDASGGRSEAHACDSSRVETVFELAKTLIARHGAPYAVINNAGIARDGLLATTSPADWSAVIDNNLTSVYAVARAFLPEMLANDDGCVIQISSVTGLKGNIGQSVYGATKAAMIGLTRSLALEVGRFNIRVNAVAPGLIATDMTDAIPPARLKKLASHIALGRLGSVEDVALTVEFLLGPGGRYVTGQTFVIDGGLTA
ncbi:MAG: 3-oxoacyl-ACP reductase [Methylocystaceae bacterium]|nr:MAG: 3-oxoacyl-ACP reductase [Methylocystaceae bacterium]